MSHPEAASVCTWYLVRHGQTEWNAERRMQGQWDSRLSEAGRGHAARSGVFLAGRPLDVIYASPLGRVQETAAIMAPHLPHPVINDDRLKEWSSGEWSGELYADIAVRDAARFGAWQADMLNVRAPGGENFHDLMVRARDFLAGLSPRSGQAIAIIAHGFINRALACTLLGEPAESMLDIRQANDVIIRIRTGDGPGEADHFQAGEGPIPGLPSGAGAAAA